MQHTVQINQWQPDLLASHAQEIVAQLEAGKVIYFPALGFDFTEDEQSLWSIIPQGAKNISYDCKNQSLRGLGDQRAAGALRNMMHRYYQLSAQLLDNIAPQYQVLQHTGRTSYRPIEIKGRIPPSYRKDDTRLHVDAFPST
ncbi:MAG TPA: Kdo hydroxylase family protein, partial [Gammaproteobacteria bacterium]|nr:Kdo hydroxylase family protein [Gammaproteobacteria bacterium]